ncbi:MAG: hypothetical protein IJN69_05015 [Oscillospiraceae bacterium]|nr:hypothetical protein [Oscillospiraceae bacterium]MBR2502900.1 hypothetical protein [Oscillospiraceae bacterium]
MKNTKTCPKCGSNDIIRFDGSSGDYGNNILTGLTALSCIPVNRYICCSCGFTEEWIDKEAIDELKNSRKAKKVK